MRPFNDNYSPADVSNVNRLDNLDLFMLSVPVSGNGWQVTPWGMLGMSGANTFKGDERQYDFKNTILYMNLLPYSYLRAEANGNMGKMCIRDRAESA